MAVSECEWSGPIEGAQLWAGGCSRHVEKCDVSSLLNSDGG